MSKTSPDHYQLGKFQVWDFIVDQDMDYLTGNIVKYISRAGTKPGESKMDDLLKAQAYLNKLIETTNANQTPRPDGSGSPLPIDYGTARRFGQSECVRLTEESDSRGV